MGIAKTRKKTRNDKVKSRIQDIRRSTSEKNTAITK